jgi:beta-lactamase class A
VARGELVAGADRELLLGWMVRTQTGAHRLRARLPAGMVADKSGTGADGAATNDVGLITLPGGRGQLAVAVLLVGSPLLQERQEDLIAEIGRTLYDAFAPVPDCVRDHALARVSPCHRPHSPQPRHTQSHPAAV